MSIETNRLLIREIIPEDWQGLKNISIDFRQSMYAMYDLPLPIEDEDIKELTKHFAETHLFFAVFLKNTDEMIGYVCFHNNNENYDLGYCFHSNHHGNGYAFESCTKLMNCIMHKGIVKGFTAGTALENTPSCKLLKRLGFTLKQTESVSFHKDEYGNDIFFEGGIFIKCIESL